MPLITAGVDAAVPLHPIGKGNTNHHGASKLDDIRSMEETSVVAVIEGKEEAGGARYIEFKVHRSKTSPSDILGSWRLAHGQSGLVDQSKLDSPVRTEFRHVLDCADQHGIPFVWINDPDELFPPWER